jgi:transposase
MTTRVDQAPLVRTIRARDLKELAAEIRSAKKHFGLPANGPVRSCYEAGRDGFWLHRYRAQQGVTNSIIDSSSIEVKRRRKRTKTDRLDACKLVTWARRSVAV